MKLLRSRSTQLKRALRTRSDLRTLLSEGSPDDTRCAEVLSELSQEELLMIAEAVEAERLLKPSGTWGPHSAAALARLSNLPPGHPGYHRSFAVLDRHLLACRDQESFRVIHSSLPVRWRRAETALQHPGVSTDLIALSAARGAFPSHSFGTLDGTPRQREVLEEVIRSVSGSEAVRLVDLCLAVMGLCDAGEMVGDVVIAASSPGVMGLSAGQLSVLVAMAHSPVLSACSAGFHLAQLGETAARLSDSTSVLTPSALEVLEQLVRDLDEPTPFDLLLELAGLVSR